MKTATRPRVCTVLLLPVAIGMVVLALLIALDNAHWVQALATIGWKLPI